MNLILYTMIGMMIGILVSKGHFYKKGVESERFDRYVANKKIAECLEARVR